MSEGLPIVTKISDYILLKTDKIQVIKNIKLGVFILYVEVIQHAKSIEMRIKGKIACSWSHKFYLSLKIYNPTFL
jgi:hypothetical protein